MDNTKLDRKLARIETSITSMRIDFDMKGEDTIEKVAARAIAGPQAEECMRIYDLLESSRIINEEDYNEHDVDRVANLMDFYLNMGGEDSGE